MLTTQHSRHNLLSEPAGTVQAERSRNRRLTLTRGHSRLVSTGSLLAMGHSGRRENLLLFWRELSPFPSLKSQCLKIQRGNHLHSQPAVSAPHGSQGHRIQSCVLTLCPGQSLPRPPELSPTDVWNIGTGLFRVDLGIERTY